MMGRGDSWFWAILMPPKLQIWVVKTFPSSFLCMASKPGRGFRRMSLEMNKDKSFSGWEVQFRELGRGELVTQPKEKEAREMEMAAGAGLEAKPLVHPLGKLVPSHGSVPVAAKEFVLRAGNTHIPPRTKSHGGGSSWGMCL